MDVSEATQIVMSRIRNLDPQNASKIIGYVLINGHGDKDMIRLAFSPDALLQAHVDQAKASLGLAAARIDNGGFRHGGGREELFGDRLQLFREVDPFVMRTDSLIFPVGEEGGFYYRPCLYYARGFCKNGSACKYLHGGAGAGGIDDVVLRMKAIQQQHHHRIPPFHYSKWFNDYPSARQIYLTFPADSTFREQDVSNYFSMFGPVQDVRIPYQQRRMFGFVTFVYPETVRLILAKGNPHFLCDCRLLVKPYKEKGKIRDKKMQHGERVDYGENLESPFGSRMPVEFEGPSSVPSFAKNMEMCESGGDREVEEIGLYAGEGVGASMENDAIDGGDQPRQPNGDGSDLPERFDGDCVGLQMASLKI
ncbi:zinc finger CCCH domain-containing protein 23-like isoform X2 [Andrographis paniculata]|uniref:zinc finger CCCH domain-containing protein 23-like isoform X2 n=1 Tax=Andrographis paniculata TaxID=175694 RepID=UPI0021E82495|nr:zinc finger CCCH domain-containing protein 23-like isoform X2 [Andrographis paniculata]